jgi:hypothetical protein
MSIITDAALKMIFHRLGKNSQISVGVGEETAYPVSQ